MGGVFYEAIPSIRELRLRQLQIHIELIFSCWLHPFYFSRLSILIIVYYGAKHKRYYCKEQ